MADFTAQVVYFTILLVVMNALALGINFLPSSTLNSTDHYNFFNETQQADLNAPFSDLDADSQVLGGDQNEVVASDTREANLNILDSIFTGFGTACDVATGAVFGVQVCGLIGLMVKYFLLLVLGYWFWINYIFAPLAIIPGIGGLFGYLALGLKVIFLLIQIIGLIILITPIFSAGRRQ